MSFLLALVTLASVNSVLLDPPGGQVRQGEVVRVTGVTDVEVMVEVSAKGNGGVRNFTVGSASEGGWGFILETGDWSVSAYQTHTRTLQNGPLSGPWGFSVVIVCSVAVDPSPSAVMTSSLPVLYTSTGTDYTPSITVTLKSPGADINFSLTSSSLPPSTLGLYTAPLRLSSSSYLHYSCYGANMVTSPVASVYFKLREDTISTGLIWIVTGVIAVLAIVWWVAFYRKTEMRKHAGGRKKGKRSYADIDRSAWCLYNLGEAGTLLLGIVWFCVDVVSDGDVPKWVTFTLIAVTLVQICCAARRTYVTYAKGFTHLSYPGWYTVFTASNEALLSSHRYRMRFFTITMICITLHLVASLLYIVDDAGAGTVAFLLHRIVSLFTLAVGIPMIFTGYVSRRKLKKHNPDRADKADPFASPMRHHTDETSDPSSHGNDPYASPDPDVLLSDVETILKAQVALAEEVTILRSLRSIRTDPTLDPSVKLMREKQLMEGWLQTDGHEEGFEGGSSGGGDARDPEELGTAEHNNREPDNREQNSKPVPPIVLPPALLTRESPPESDKKRTATDSTALLAAVLLGKGRGRGNALAALKKKEDNTDTDRGKLEEGKSLVTSPDEHVESDREQMPSVVKKSDPTQLDEQAALPVRDVIKEDVVKTESATPTPTSSPLPKPSPKKTRKLSTSSSEALRNPLAKSIAAIRTSTPPSPIQAPAGREDDEPDAAHSTPTRKGILRTPQTQPIEKLHARISPLVAPAKSPKIISPQQHPSSPMPTSPCTPKSPWTPVPHTSVASAEAHSSNKEQPDSPTTGLPGRPQQKSDEKQKELETEIATLRAQVYSDRKSSQKELQDILEKYKLTPSDDGQSGHAESIRDMVESVRSERRMSQAEMQETLQNMQDKFSSEASNLRATIASMEATILAKEFSTVSEIEQLRAELQKLKENLKQDDKKESLQATMKEKENELRVLKQQSKPPGRRTSGMTLEEVAGSVVESVIIPPRQRGDTAVSPLSARSYNSEDSDDRQMVRVGSKALLLDMVGRVGGLLDARGKEIATTASSPSPRGVERNLGTSQKSAHSAASQDHVANDSPKPPLVPTRKPSPVLAALNSASPPPKRTGIDIQGLLSSPRGSVSSASPSPRGRGRGRGRGRSLESASKAAGT